MTTTTITLSLTKDEDEALRRLLIGDRVNFDLADVSAIGWKTRRHAFEVARFTDGDGNVGPAYRREQDLLQSVLDKLSLESLPT